VVLAGCSSRTELRGDTLPPLIGGPTTFTVTPTTAPAIDPSATTLPGTSTTTLSTTTLSTTTSTTTTPSTTTPPVARVTWGGWPYYQVPQLGSEPVRGTGCGANGGLGDVVPDGVWNVIIGDGSGADRFWSGGTMAVDMRCIYAGDAGRAQWNTVCGAVPDADACASQSPDWFVVNVNSRLRSMPVASGVQYGVGALGSTPCPGVTLDPGSRDAPWRFMDSWIVIDRGVVTSVIAACPAG
jgi:hypothetical protein